MKLLWRRGERLAARCQGVGEIYFPQGIGIRSPKGLTEPIRLLMGLRLPIAVKRREPVSKVNLLQGE
ncbi:MAG: hypothetical protein LBC94_01460 [Desulfovibrio sp.]|nr:hypothetical protein [Desulfovibrio sp.]